MEESLHDWKFHSVVQGGGHNSSRRWECTKCGGVALADDRPDYDQVVMVQMKEAGDGDYLRLNCGETILYKIHVT